MIKSFHAFDANQVQNAQLVGGIDEALITTTPGLIVAIPALIAYNHLVNRVNLVAEETFLLGEQIVEELESSAPVFETRKGKRNFNVLEGKQGIDLAAMVDIIFLLLAYFLINSTLVKTPAIKIDLPRSEASTYAEETAIDIFVKADGKIFINENETPDNRVSPALKAAIARQGGKLPEVNIKGDRKTSYQRIIKTIDLVRKAGLSDFNLTTIR